MLVGLKAEVLEASMLPPPPEVEEYFESDFEIRDGWIPASIYPDDQNVISYGVR